MSEKRARPLLMGILNITPDSFFQSHFALEDAIAHAKSIVNAKADILDVGGESTRPGSIEITEEEEIRRNFLECHRGGIGRRRGLKIRCSARGVPVRVRPVALSIA